MHKPLYEVIEKIIDLTIPVWNQTLGALLQVQNLRIEYSECEYNPDPYSLPEEEKPQRLPDETDYAYWDRREEWERDNRRIVRPEPEAFAEPSDYTGDVDLKNSFIEKGLQIIVKLANIHLTPDKPEYEGGTWHVEGQLVCVLHLYLHSTSHAYIMHRTE